MIGTMLLPSRVSASGICAAGMYMTGGGGRLPVAMISVSTPEVLPAPSIAVAVIVTGVPGGTVRDANKVNGS